MRRNAFIGFLLVFAFLSGRVGAQPTADTVWEKCFGGSHDDYGQCVVHTSDGGFAIAGYTYSQDDQVTGNHGAFDGWVVKLNSAGVIQWQKCLGGAESDYLFSIIQTSDGGYAVTGETYSSDGDVSGYHGGGDVWVVKLNDTGGIQWQKCLGGSSEDAASAIIQTTDGGFAVAASSNSTDGEVSGNHGEEDFWIVKLNDTGAILWEKSLGGSNDEQASSIIQTTDGGFAVAGLAESANGDVNGYHGGGDAWVVKLNDTGAIKWQNSLGGSGDDYAYSIIQSSDGGFAIAGYTKSDDGDASGNHGGADDWVVKLDVGGSIEWQKCLGGSNDDYAYSLIQTSDQGYAVAGWTSSNNDEVSGNYSTTPGSGNEWVVKLNDTGAIQWQKCLGGTVDDAAQSIIQIPSGDYVIAGTTSSNDSDVSGNHGGWDEWLVELSPPDPPVISYITPDAGAPGMCVAVEIIGPAGNQGNFGGGDDQLYVPDTLVTLTRASDHALVRLGPSVVSWNGRMIQQMFMIEPHTGPIDTEIYFQVTWNGQQSAIDSFRIVTPAHVGILPAGGGTLPTSGRTVRNTMVIDSMILTSGTYTCPQTDPDPTTAGNQSYLPLRILSMGPIVLSNATLSANGYNGTTGTSGGNGGSGGGGGGSGYPGAGGNGYTGGGGNNDNSSGPGGIGTGSTNGSVNWTGGMSLDSVTGALGEQHSGSGGDDGGGGGTGHPFGTSGVNGNNSSSPTGGFGGASSGGSTSTYLTNYGGGGGGNEAPGGNGGGTGSNAGQVVGNPMLVPLFGGSGGGAGNCTRITTEEGGSGGGGGGAIELTSFSSVSVPNGSSIISNGGNGSNGKAGLANGAGGGGGAGGAISISARDSVVIGSSTLMAEKGGSGGIGQNSGGTGGVGRIRINGYVSKFSSPGSANYFTPSHGYTGPSIQQVTYTADSFYVHAFSGYWDSIPKPTNNKMEVWWAWPSSITWRSMYASYVSDLASHTAEWVYGDTLSTNPIDTELYVVAVQDEDGLQDNYADVPGNIMSHTGGIIVKVTGPPQALVQPTTINFGDVLVGQCSDDTTIEVHSTGKSALSVDSAKLLGVDASQFKIVSLISQFVSPGDSLAITLQFCPDSVKCPMNATLRVFTAAGSTDISLTGCGVQPDMSIKPDTINFGRVHIGDCKDTTFIVTDTGKDPLTVTSESFGNLQFKIVGTLPIIVPAGGSKQIEIQYCPTDTSLTQSGDTVRGNAPQSPITLILIGGGKIGILSMPKIIDFGPVHEDSCKDTVVYATNKGNDTLSLENELISASGFSHILTVFPIVVQPDSSVPLEIQFCSTDTGSFEATMIVGTDVPSADTVLLLAHTGIGILQIANVIDFDSVAIGGCADTIIPIKNVGTDTLLLDTNLVFQPPFSYHGPSQIVLAPGATTTIQLLFCPQDTSEASETTQFDTIGAGENKIFTLRGKGIEGSLSTSGFFDLGCLVQGTSATITDTIRNIGAATLQNLGAAILPVAAAQIVHNPPSSLAPGGIDSVVLVIPATTLGTFSATLTLSWTDGTPVTVPITGQISLPPAILSRNLTTQFDSTNVGDSTVIECIQITNYSCVPMPIDSIFVPGGLANGYEIVSNSAGSTISDSAIATICLRFKPVRNGSSFDSLVVVSGGDTITISNLSGYGIGKGVGVELAVDTVAGRPGDIVNVPVRTLNDVTSASIDTVTFRVSFDPMQLDLKAPLPPTVPSIESNATPTYTVKTYSIGDKEITAAFSTPLTGTPTIAELPFEILQPTANTASIHVVSASFGASLATLSTTSDGLIEIEQCDTNDRVTLAVNPIDVEQNNPNPFNERAAISVNVNTAGHLKIEVYNALGMKVLVPFDANVSVGTQTVELDASALPSGAYHYITTWTWVGSNVPSYQPTYARDEKTMILLGK